MPSLFGKKEQDPEDAPQSGDPAADLAAQAELRTHTLTQELLDWLIASLEAVIKTPQFQDLAQKRVQSSLRDALKYADYLYPSTLSKEVTDASTDASGELRAVDEVHVVLGGTAGRDGLDSASGRL